MSNTTLEELALASISDPELESEFWSTNDHPQIFFFKRGASKIAQLILAKAKEKARVCEMPPPRESFAWLRLDDLENAIKEMLGE